MRFSRFFHSGFLVTMKKTLCFSSVSPAHAQKVLRVVMTTGDIGQTINLEGNGLWARQ